MWFTLLFIIIAVIVICWVIYQFLSGKKKTRALEVKKPEEPKTPMPPPQAPVPPQTPTPPPPIPPAGPAI